MLTDKLQKLAKLRLKVALLERKIAARQRLELAGLPAKYGFASVAEFVTAVSGVSGKRRGRKPGRVGTASGGGGRKRRRAKITDKTRAQVKKMVQAENTGAEIAGALGISLPSVQNIKKALGLVRKPKK